MREKIIRSLSTVVWIFSILMLLGGLIGGVAVMANPYRGGFFPGLMVIVGTVIYAILILGFYFMQLGVYEHTKRTAEAVEKLANR